MKWRNQLLAFLCLLAFGGVGVIYFQHWVIRKPFGISYLSERGWRLQGWRLLAPMPLERARV